MGRGRPARDAIRGGPRTEAVSLSIGYSKPASGTECGADGWCVSPPSSCGVTEGSASSSSSLITIARLLPLPGIPLEVFGCRTAVPATDADAVMLEFVVLGWGSAALAAVADAGVVAEAGMLLLALKGFKGSGREVVMEGIARLMDGWRARWAGPLKVRTSRAFGVDALLPARPAVRFMEIPDTPGVPALPLCQEARDGDGGREEAPRFGLGLGFVSWLPMQVVAGAGMGAERGARAAAGAMGLGVLGKKKELMDFCPVAGVGEVFPFFPLPAAPSVSRLRFAPPTPICIIPPNPGVVSKWVLGERVSVLCWLSWFHVGDRLRCCASQQAP